MNVLPKKTDRISLKSYLWIFWDHLQGLKSLFSENISIQVASWHFKSKGKYKWNYLTRLHFREKPAPEEEWEMKAGEAGFQSTRDQRMKKRIQAEKDTVGFFFF